MVVHGQYHGLECFDHGFARRSVSKHSGYSSCWSIRSGSKQQSLETQRHDNGVAHEVGVLHRQRAYIARETLVWTSFHAPAEFHRYPLVLDKLSAISQVSLVGFVRVSDCKTSERPTVSVGCHHHCCALRVVHDLNDLGVQADAL